MLPVEQYPDLTPPQVEVNATYTGASANVIAETVASLLESQINGVDNMIYMNSVSSGTGSMSLTVSFNVGTDPDQATIDVNNRVQLAPPPCFRRKCSAWASRCSKSRPPCSRSSS